MRRLLLTAEGGSSGSPTPGPSTDLRPATADPVLASIRPASRCIATLRVGPTRTYTTIAAAKTAAINAQNAQAAAEGVVLGLTNGHPDFRVDILIDPGTYLESMGSARDVAFYSATGIPGDVIVAGQSGTLGCLDSGEGIYVEGVTFWRGALSGVSTANLPKYAQHHVTNGTRSAIMANCTFHTQVEHDVGGWTVIGMDGYNGGKALWYGCTLSTATTSTGTNLHGGATNTVAGEYMFIDTDAPTVSVGYNSLHASLADKFWVVGGQVASITTGGAGTILHREPGVSLGTVTASGPVDSNTAWPVPTGGLTATERAYYYP